MLFLYGVALFLLGATFFLAVPALWTHARAHQLREPRTILCPETRRWAQISLDARRAARAEISGRTDLHLVACSSWPQRRDCGQDCLPQFAFVGDDRRLTPYAPFALEPRFLRINNPVRMSPALYARLSRP